MNRFLVILTLFAIAPGLAGAVCPTNRITGNAIGTLLSGKTVCVRGASDWENQEIHGANGSLSDYKKGPNDPIDPTAVIGGWRRQGSLVEYRYSGGDTFTYEVYYSAPNICLKNNTITVEGTLFGSKKGKVYLKLNFPFLYYYIYFLLLHIYCSI